MCRRSSGRRASGRIRVSSNCNANVRELETMASLDIEHLAYRIASQMVLANVEMTVGEGEIHALLASRRYQQDSKLALEREHVVAIADPIRQRLHGRWLRPIEIGVVFVNSAPGHARSADFHGHCALDQGLEHLG
jgi:hypothetical protein